MLPTAEAPGGPAATAALAAPMALAGMLALQEAEGSAVGDRAARRHGQALLSRLTRLQRALLAGPADPGLLDELARLVEAQPPAADPALAGVLRAIAVRVRVELARLGR